MIYPGFGSFPEVVQKLNDYKNEPLTKVRQYSTLLFNKGIYICVTIWGFSPSPK